MVILNQQKLKKFGTKTLIFRLVLLTAKPRKNLPNLKEGFYVKNIIMGRMTGIEPANA